MRREFQILIVLLLALASLSPQATYATPERPVYDCPDPEANSGDDDEPLVTLGRPEEQSSPAPRQRPAVQERSSARLWVEQLQEMFGRAKRWIFVSKQRHVSQ
jgi:hypothetical protein